MTSTRNRLGYVGHSLGATWGGAVAGTDTRVRAFVLMGGLPNLVDRETSYPEDLWCQIVEANTEEQLSEYRSVVSTVSPERFVGDAPPGSIFFQFARYDRFISDAGAAAYERAAREPHVRWYATSHELNDLASLCDRAEWLREKLELDPVLPLLRSKLSR